MGMNTFATGLAGLNANGQGLNVVGNNLANLNTIPELNGNIDVNGNPGGPLDTATWSISARSSAKAPRA